MIRVGRLWLAGAVLLVLRTIQLNTGFDPATGLSRPSLAGKLVWIGLLACLAVETVLCLRCPKDGKRSYACCFQTPEGPAPAGLIAGGFLLIAGGALLLIGALPPAGTMIPVLAGVFGILGGAGLLLLVKELRSEEPPAVLPLLPAMFFSVLFILTIYYAEGSNPVLERFYPMVLAAVLSAYFLYQLSGFFRQEGSLRWFGFMGSLAVIACVTAAADLRGDPGRALVCLGFAVTASVFLALLREEPLPEPEKEEEGEPEEEQA